MGGGGSSDPTPTPTPNIDDNNKTNLPDPVIVLGADAGPDQSVLTTSSVILNGGESQAPADSDGRLAYEWEFVSSPGNSSASLSGETSVAPRFTADVDGDYEVQLTVYYGDESATDTVMITATTGNIAPIAAAGDDQNVKKGTKVTLDGSGSSDANRDGLTYRWSLVERPDGSNASLSSKTVPNPSFTADKEGTYKVELVVNDGRLDSIADTVLITASSTNSKPVAKAGADQSVKTGTKVTLDGSSSTDVDGDNFTLRWTMTEKPAGSSASLSNPTAVKPTFTADKEGTYRISLIVNDGKVNSSADTVDITASTENSFPIADAGPDQTIRLGETVTLDGSKSYDDDGDELDYFWIVYGPEKSGEDFQDNNGDFFSVSPRFTPDIAGIYTIDLVVASDPIASDGVSDYMFSPEDTMILTVTEADTNSAPVIHSVEFTSEFDARYPLDVGYTTQLQANADDANGDSLSYFWAPRSRPPESSGDVLVYDIDEDKYVYFTADAPGDYVIEAQTFDGELYSESKTITITVRAPSNRPPVAILEEDRTIEVNDTTYLYTDSYDPDGDEIDLYYKWRLVSGPVFPQTLVGGGEGAELYTGLAGTYVVELIVNDGQVDSEPDYITITILNDYQLSPPAPIR